LLGSFFTSINNVVIIDTSKIGDEAELLIGSIIASNIFYKYQDFKSQGQLEDKPPLSIIIEEAPRVLGSDRLATAGANIYSKIAREGRKFKVGLVNSILYGKKSEIQFRGMNDNELRFAILHEEGHIEQVQREAVRILRRNHAVAGGTFVCGLEGHTPEEILMVPEYARNLGMINAAFPVATPHAATEFYRGLDDRGLINEPDWGKFDLKKEVLDLCPTECMWVEGKKLKIDEDILYERSMRFSMEKVDNGEAKLAFLLNPISPEVVWQVAQKNERLPEKSTDFYPKPASGLVMMDIAPEEKL
jgi:hypothetical protein